jgi:hypothetical protein
MFDAAVVAMEMSPRALLTLGCFEWTAMKRKKRRSELLMIDA